MAKIINILEGQFLSFIPPKLAGGESGTKNRYMLVTKNDVTNNKIEMINVSSIKGKEHKLIYDSNIIINNYFPLPKPSFAKLDTIYLLDNFEDLNRYIAFKGERISENELINIINQRIEYISKKGKCKNINIEESEFKKINKISLKLNI